MIKTSVSLESVKGCPFEHLSGVWRRGVFDALHGFDIPT